MFLPACARAAAAVHNDARLGEKGLEQQRVADDAEIRTQADQRDLPDIVAQILVQTEGQFFRAERILQNHVRFVRHVLFHQRHPDGGAGRPALGACDTVSRGQPTPLLRLQIVFLMGVKGEIDRAVKVQYRFHNSGLDCLRLRAAESAGNEIVLHVHNDQYVHAMIGLRFVLG